MREPEPAPPDAVDPRTVRRYLARILASAEFSSASRLQQLLAYLVEETLKGADTIKETELAIRVFNRRSSFDPSGDSLVRVAASNLRHRLRDYYLNTGIEDPVVIELPKGCYIPCFRLLAPVASAAPARRLSRSAWTVAAVVAGLLLGAGGAAYWTLVIEPHRALSSIAVLPFLNLSPNPDNEYLADGFVEELTTSLAQIEGLRVVARSSAFQFRGKNPDLRTAGRQLGVGTVLEGSLRTVGGRIRISSQLINVADGFHIWSHLWEGESKDIPSIEDDLAHSIAAALRHTGAARSKAPRDLEAYDLYLKGQYFRDRATTADLTKSIGYLEQSILRDPAYAPAHSALAGAYASLAYHQLAGDRDTIAHAKEAAAKALSLDDSLAEPHALLAWIRYFFDWDWTGSESELRRALALSPNTPHAHDWYAQRLLAEGRFDEALVETRKALALDPLSYRTSTNVAVVLYCAHRYDEALRQTRQALDLNPHYYQAHTIAGASFQGKGMYREAEAELRAAMSDYADDADTISHLAAVASAQGHREEALHWRSALEKPAGQASPAYYELAALSVAMGEKDRAFDALEKSYRERSSDMIVLAVDPAFDSLHSDPRFLQLRKKMGWTH